MMAKGKKHQNRSETRDHLGSLTVRLRSRAAIGSALQEVQDLRAFDFEPGTTPARFVSGGIASQGVTHTPNKQKAPSKVPYQIAFSAPAETLVCVRRRRRKEVLFAKKHTGKGGQKRPRWNRWSSTKC